MFTTFANIYSEGKICNVIKILSLAALHRNIAVTTKKVNNQVP